MFVLYAFLISVGLTLIGFIFIKNFQLENYKIKRYIKNIVRFDFSFGDKNKLIFTKRVKRLILINFLLNFAYFLLFFGLIPYLWINFGLSIVLVLFSPIVIVISYAVAKPMEELIKLHYLKKAKRKLQKLNCKKIAITGSFGKTSTKNILYQILAEEFDVCATPKSYNTPMGICKTILEDLKETDEFFIVEMGAKHVGDIGFLAKYVGVDFGIMTPIGNCHLETFGSIENIEKTKELVKVCREKGLSLEAEVGAIGGEEDGVVGKGECADPDECKKIADLGVTMLAAGIGNIHGKYPADWAGLSFETLAAVKDKVGDMPLVLHGGTGIPVEMIKKAISLGVAKINVNTECQLAFQEATRKYIEEGKDLSGKGFDPRKLLAPGCQAIKDTVKEKMEIFGSIGKA